MFFLHYGSQQGRRNRGVREEGVSGPPKERNFTVTLPKINFVAKLLLVKLMLYYYLFALTKPNSLARREMNNVVDHFKNDLSVNKLQRQLPMLPDIIEGKKVEELRDLVNIMRDQQPQTRRLFSEISTCMKLLLVLPASSATAERTFSNLRRLKTWLRSTISQKSLNQLSVLSVHRDLAKNISELAIAKKFINNVSTRATILGKIQ